MEQPCKARLTEVFQALSSELSGKYSHPTDSVGIRFPQHPRNDNGRVSEQEARFALAEILLGGNCSFGVEIPTVNRKWSKKSNESTHPQCYLPDLNLGKPGMIDMVIYENHTNRPAVFIEFKKGHGGMNWDFAKLFSEPTVSSQQAGWYCLLESFRAGTAKSLTDKIQRASNVATNDYLKAYQDTGIEPDVFNSKTITIAIHVLNKAKVWIQELNLGNMGKIDIPNMPHPEWIQIVAKPGQT